MYAVLISRKKQRNTPRSALTKVLERKMPLRFSKFLFQTFLFIYVATAVGA